MRNEAGEAIYDLNYYAVKLTSIDSSNTLAQFTTDTVLTGGSNTEVLLKMCKGGETAVHWRSQDKTVCDTKY